MTIWRKMPGGQRKASWRAPTRGTDLLVADDSLSLTDIQPRANLVERNAGPATRIFTFFRPDAPPVHVTLSEMIRNVPALPLSTSHKS